MNKIKSGELKVKKKSQREKNKGWKEPKDE